VQHSAEVILERQAARRSGAAMATQISFHCENAASKLVRKRMTEDVLIRGESPFPPSLTLLAAAILFLFGLTVIMSMRFHVGPFE
jgi:hypothetical protein